IGNPGIGWMTTQKSMKDVVNPRGLPSQVESFRVLWSEIEPSENVFDFSKLDAAIANARAANQQINFRLIGAEPGNSMPSWLRQYGGWVATCGDNGYATQDAYPDLSIGTVRAAYSNLVNRVATRYRNDPAI